MKSKTIADKFFPIMLTVCVMVGLAGCGGGGMSSVPSTTTTLSAIAVSPTTATVNVGSTQQFTATCSYSDNSSSTCTTLVTWASSDTSKGTIGASTGLFTGVATGTTNVSASWQGKTSNSVQVTVTTQTTLSFITISPDPATVKVGNTQQFAATCTYSDSATSTCTASVTWVSSDTSKGTIGASTGLFTGVAAGSTNVSASWQGVTSNSVSATVTTADLSAIGLSPDLLSITAGRTQQLSATCAFTDETTADCTQSVSWASSDTSKATVGLATGLLTAAASGTTDLTASWQGVTSAPLSVQVMNENSLDSTFGMCHVLWCRAVAEDETQCRDLAEQANVNWVRIDFTWADIEPAQGTFDFAGHDQLVDEGIAQGFTIIGVIVYNNPWSSGNDSPATAQQRQDYADYVTTLVLRYQNKVTYWEIWNEPDGENFWKPAPNAADYTELLKSAYAAAKAADPSVNIIGLGGVDPGKTEYITTTFQNGALDNMDIVSFHPYCDPDIYETCFQTTNFTAIKNLMAQYNSSIPVWATEVGYPTYAQGVSEARQAEMLVRVHASLLSSGYENVVWYKIADETNAESDENDRERHFGVLASDLSAKPAYNSYKYLTTTLDGYKLSKEYYVCDTCKAVMFDKTSTGEEVLLLWTYGETVDANGNVTAADEQNISLTISGSISGVTDIFGQDSAAVSASGTTLFGTINNSPIYVMGDFEIVGQ